MRHAFVRFLGGFVWLRAACAFSKVWSYATARLTSTRLWSSSSTANPLYDATQWSMFATHSGRWEGVWTTFDQSGSEHSELCGLCKVELLPENRARHSLSVNGNEIPVGEYQAGNLGRQVCAGAGMIAGPSVLKRSGLVSTELSLRHGASRLRCTVQHAPAFGGEDQSEAGLLLYRAIVCRERCDGTGAPTRAKEQARNDFGVDETRFWRGIPPFRWAAEWRGISTTATDSDVFTEHVDRLGEDDLWHLSRSGEASYTLQLPGGIRLQAPTVLSPNFPAPFRLAWLPCDQPILFRAQALALILQDDANSNEELYDHPRFSPPRLLSFRVDELQSDTAPKKPPEQDNDDRTFLRGQQ